MRLFHAISVAHAGLTEPLDVRFYGNTAVWKPELDTGWQEYMRAMEVLSHYPFITKVLEKLGYI